MISRPAEDRPQKVLFLRFIGFFLPVVLSLGLASGAALGEVAMSSEVQIAKFECSGPKIICDGPKKFGMSHGNSALTPNYQTAVTPSLQLLFQTFSMHFDIKRLRSENKRGRLTVVTWSPCKTCKGRDDTVRLEDISAGKFDEYLWRSAKALKSAKIPVVIRFAHEMNGYWTRWGMPKPGDPRSFAYPGNTPAKYVAAYRHINKLFKRAGARNVLWMWSPDIIQVPGIVLSKLFPGKSYVDVIGLSGYFVSETDSFLSRFIPTLDLINKFAARKPILVIESGVSRIPSRPELIKDLIGNLGRYDQVRGLYWLITTTEKDYSLIGDDLSIKALNEALSQNPYQISPNGLHAIVSMPRITGEALVGSTLKAKASYQGTQKSLILEWMSCGDRDDLSSCESVGEGSFYQVKNQDYRHYLRAHSIALNGVFKDEAYSVPVGPIFHPLNLPDKPEVTYRNGFTVIDFGKAAPAGVSNRVLTINSGEKQYLPMDMSQYWAADLKIGVNYEVDLQYLDKYAGIYKIGPKLRLKVIPLLTPAEPVISVGPTQVTISLPAVQQNQTNWTLRVNGQDEITIPITQTAYRFDKPTDPNSVIAITAVSFDGKTRPREVPIFVK